MKFKKGEKLSFINLHNGPCIYYIRNLTNGKIYIGSTKNYRTRISVHVTKLRKPHLDEPIKYGTVPRDMLQDFEAGHEFESNVLCKIGENVDGKKIRALEGFLIIMFDTVGKGYNRMYTNISREWTVQDAMLHSDFIVSHLLDMDKMDIKNSEYQQVPKRYL